MSAQHSVDVEMVPEREVVIWGYHARSFRDRAKVYLWLRDDEPQGLYRMRHMTASGEPIDHGEAPEDSCLHVWFTDANTALNFKMRFV
ncbi:MAG: hypothetical protein EOP83_02630 [Verrucomicrobiaceae bacterium]|nr:MAG: hypothetical protein EOP83_02630 [Verrucomicrobiaceae bacterium]